MVTDGNDLFGLKDVTWRAIAVDFVRSFFSVPENFYSLALLPLSFPPQNAGKSHFCPAGSNFPFNTEATLPANVFPALRKERVALIVFSFHEQETDDSTNTKIHLRVYRACRGKKYKFSVSGDVAPP